MAISFTDKCHKCKKLILPTEVAMSFHDHQHPDEIPKVWFHKSCYNRYEHYYGLDRPID